VEQLVASELAEETEVLEQNRRELNFIHNKSQVT
jgi:hypothetical protein